MGVLYALESIRTPALDKIMSVITLRGGELFFMVIAVTAFWCVSKREGYYLMIVGFFGTVINQFLKILCCVPRPWIKDPDFTIVESARAEATGYSFPSGHTQNAVATYGGIARYRRHGAVHQKTVAAVGVSGGDGADLLQPDVSGCPHAAGCGRVVPDRGGAGAGGLSADGGGRPASGGADVHHTGYGGVQRGLRGVSVPAGRYGCCR